MGELGIFQTINRKSQKEDLGVHGRMILKWILKKQGELIHLIQDTDQR
jgi:hypothetical protein